MDYNNIKICLEQKNIFMTNIVNLTKQIEVKAKQEEIDFEDVLVKREENMQRIDKCNKLIDDNLKDLLSNEKEQVINALRGEIGEECQTPILKEISLLAKNYSALLERAIELDKMARECTVNRYNETKQKLSEIRSNNAKQNMYHD